MFTKRIGIDLGTANTLVCVPKRGMIINEPTVVAVSLDDNKILAVGLEAKQMLGRTHENIKASRPMREGVIADYRITETMLRYFINKATGGVRLIRPEVMVSVPVGITSTERRAVVDATMNAGAKAVYLIKQPVAAAIGAGIPIGQPVGNLIIDIGGGTTEVAVISLGGVVTANSCRVAGNKFDQAITDYIRAKHNLAIGEATAEAVKIKLGSALPIAENKKMEIRGRDIVGGLPASIEVSSHEVTEAIQDPLREIINVVKSVLQKTPPELSADVIDRGMVLSGGSSLLRNMDKLVSKAIGVPCYLAEDPLLCVVRGTGAALESLEVYKHSILFNKPR
ncbi:rod shape-determining protein [bacterium (Candidatus Torokbacteria) CG09_land_8_20_14_0_10_42_11]|nr:MAG: rod shape-determining protein [bacterium (Candidatus Torokbacteria) CG09_land_8_20_14_0_10_42_11]